MPLTEDETENLVSTAGAALQELQNEFGRENIPTARVRFPRGYLDTAVKIRRTLPRIGREVQRRNAAYALINLDVLRWLVIRTDISGAALSMLVKSGICILGNLCDWMTKEANRGHASNRYYKTRTRNLVRREIISEDLKIDLDWTWDIRCDEHIHEIYTLEHDRYSRNDMNRAVQAFSDLRNILIEIRGSAV